VPTLEITPGERLALQLLAENKTPTEIADCLGVESNELSTHLSRLYSKIGASSPAEAVAAAWRRGLLPVADFSAS
jgi:DNA-binding CsgD family transcriptional regulator